MRHPDPFKSLRYVNVHDVPEEEGAAAPLAVPNRNLSTNAKYSLTNEMLTQRHVKRAANFL